MWPKPCVAFAAHRKYIELCQGQHRHSVTSQATLLNQLLPDIQLAAYPQLTGLPHKKQKGTPQP
jgi:hypothetical protein